VAYLAHSARLHRRLARASRTSRQPRPIPVALVLCLVGALAFGAVALVVALIWGLVWFGQFAGTLPPPDELTARQVFQTTRVVASDESPLYEITDPEGGRRTVIRLDQMPRALIEATIATEDPGFFSNPGFEIRSILRASVEDLGNNGIVSGASTITQQVVRNVLLGPDERYQLSLRRKIRELVLAYQLTQTYTKDEILQIYLNEIPYGNRSYGIEAAAQGYFGKSAVNLDLAESALLAGLPQAPGEYDPFTRPDEVKQRQEYVLQRMVQQGYITADEADAAAAEPLQFVDRRHAQVAPHFVVYVTDILSQQMGVDALYHDGDAVITTLDPTLQSIAEQAVSQNLASLAHAGGNNLALVALDPQTGRILALVGSANFDDGAIAGQVNMALAPRQSGGILSPLTFASAIEAGRNLLTPIEVPATPGAASDSSAGSTAAATEKVTLADALGRGLTDPTSRLLVETGNQGFLDLADRIGVANVVGRVTYGLGSVIAGVQVTPLEVAQVYAALAAGGVARPPSAIVRVVDSSGQTVTQTDTVGHPALDPGVAYLVSSVLADPKYDDGSGLLPSRAAAPIAARAAIADDRKDAWAAGYTSNLVVVVWAGNVNGLPMTDGSPAVQVWNAFTGGALESRPPGSFSVPADVVDVAVCPNPACASKVSLPAIKGTEKSVQALAAASQANPETVTSNSRTPLVDRSRGVSPAGGPSTAPGVTAVTPTRNGLLTIPDVAGTSPEGAHERLVAAGLVVAPQIQYVSAGELPAGAKNIAVGQVVGTAPGASEQVAAGTSVVLVIRRS
jgi:membrane peptidoglycan carboxypeptidase